MKYCRTFAALTLALSLPLTSCGGSDPAPETPSDTAANAANTAAAAYWSDTTIANAQEVRVARESAKDGDSVVLRGTLQEFGELATFRLVDDAMEDCTETDDAQCETPWDYCCADPDELKRFTVNVEFPENGLPGDWTLKGKHGLDHLSEVVVAGILRKDDAGNLRLEAERLSLQ